jgi:hypothetical protein
VRSTGASILSLFQNLFGLALGPFITGALSDAWGLVPAMAVVPGFCVLAALAFLRAARTYEADKVHAEDPRPATPTESSGNRNTFPAIHTPGTQS